MAGDMRATEQPGLASMHSLFVNEHNRIARNISELDPTLSDENIYQMARQIVVAELQNIVYDEFLPVVLGTSIMGQYNISLPESGSTSYDNTVSPNIFNEFATFAFRFGHTLVPNFFNPSKSPIRTESNLCPLKDNFHNFEQFVLGSDFSGKAWENLLHGISNTESPHYDAKLNDHLTNFLFCEDNCRMGVGFGQDLAARNIQRGRDHGLPGYVRYRELCGLSVPADWADKPEDISQTNWDNLQSVYTSVEDIDAFTGAFSEASVSDGLVGATIACILGRQFRNLMVGDRFFFTHPNGGYQHEYGMPGSMKSMVRQRKLSDIICDNMDVAIVR